MSPIEPVHGDGSPPAQPGPVPPASRNDRWADSWAGYDAIPLFWDAWRANRRPIRDATERRAQGVSLGVHVACEVLRWLDGDPPASLSEHASVLATRGADLAEARVPYSDWIAAISLFREAVRGLLERGEIGEPADAAAILLGLHQFSAWCTAVVGESFFEAMLGERRRADLLAATVDSSGDAILTKDLDGTITSWNRGAERLYGYSAAEAVSQHVSLIVPPDELDRLASIMASLEMGQRVDHLEAVRVTKTGDRRLVSLTLSPLLSPAGRIVGASSIARDVTDQRRAEEIFRLTIDSAPNGMVWVDAAGAIVRTNRALDSIFGYAHGELLGEPVDVLLPAALRESHAGFRRTYLDRPDGRAMTGRELVARRKDGSEVPVEVGLTATASHDGQLVLAVVEDISRRKEVEASLRTQTADLQRSNADLEQFAYVASHDLQEPLRMVATYTQLLADRYAGRLDERADKYIGYAVEGAERMQRLVRDLLAYSRVGTRAAALQPTSSQEALDVALTALHGKIAEASAAVVVKSPLPRVIADGAQLAIVFQNLLDNALKFTGADPPRLEVGAARRPDLVEFFVTDNGIGIEHEFADRIFQMFQRLHERGKYEGSGIGLAIVKKIVERHGGTVRFESDGRSGTTFYFTMPAGGESTDG